MLYIKLFIEREKNIGQSAPECPFNRKFQSSRLLQCTLQNVHSINAMSSDHPVICNVWRLGPWWWAYSTPPAPLLWNCWVDRRFPDFLQLRPSMVEAQAQNVPVGLCLLRVVDFCTLSHSWCRVNFQWNSMHDLNPRNKWNKRQDCNPVYRSLYFNYTWTKTKSP